MSEKTNITENQEGKVRTQLFRERLKEMDRDFERVSAALKKAYRRAKIKYGDATHKRSPDR